MRARFLTLVPMFLVATLPCFASAPRLADLERLVKAGHADEAEAGLQSYLATNGHDGQAHLLLCRAYYSEGVADGAVSECEAALQTLGNNSAAQDWMGRAYGIKADQSGPITGYKMAAKVKAAFERAVELDPRNPDAVNDAGEYYVGAPSMVGGGTDKAFALADKVVGQLPAVAHRIRGLAAEKNKDYGTAEREFRDAVGTSSGKPDAWFDLGHYYYKRGQKMQAVDALQHAIAAHAKKGPALVDVASVLIKMKMNLDVAQRILREYLAGTSKDEDAPAFRALTELGKALELSGDKNGARVQYQNALALAKDYEPAKKALGKL